MKNLWNVLVSDNSWTTKTHATFHMLNSSLFIWLLLLGLSSVPLALINGRSGTEGIFPVVGILQLISAFAFMFVYWVSRYHRVQQREKTHVANFVATMVSFVCVSSGLALHNAVATIKGFFGVKSSFVRTPKFAVDEDADRWTRAKEYVGDLVTPIFFLEVFLALFFFAGVGIDIYYGQYFILPFHLMCAIGYSIVTYFVMKDFAIAAAAKRNQATTG